MQAIILAAGRSSRFYPFTNFSHKSLIKILGKSVIEHTILSLKAAEITEIIVVVGKESTIPSLLQDGKHLGVSIQYVVQVEPLGMGNALLLAKEYIHDNFLLLNAHHVDVATFITEMKRVLQKDVNGVLLAETRVATWKYGVLRVKENKVLDLVEKPKKGEEPSKFCVVGIYLFSPLFFDALSKTPNDHYQLEAAIAQFAKTHEVVAVKAWEKTVTLKYPWDILIVKNYLLENMKEYISPNASIAKTAEIIGNVYIEDGVKVLEGACIKGPCYIGKNAFIGTKAIVRNDVDIEESAVIGASMEIKNTLVQEGATTHSGFIGDSVIGANCKIGGLFCTANVRLDRSVIAVQTKDETIETELKSLGVLMGDNVRIGTLVSTMPGVIIGKNAIIGPSTVVLHSVRENVKYYTRFQEVIEEQG